MLSDAFLEWWFSPWNYALAARTVLPMATDQLGRRDGYRLWCARAAVIAPFPERFDPGWHVAMLDHGPELIATASLFAGLIAARERDQKVLAQLEIADRKWCMSVALTQPLKGCRRPFAADDSIAIRGLVELACHLEPGFPGLWSRLRLILPAALASRVDTVLHAALAVSEIAEGPAIRAQRCWLLCRRRVASGG